jgi:hypothetical protein
LLPRAVTRGQHFAVPRRGRHRHFGTPFSRAFGTDLDGFEELISDFGLEGIVTAGLSACAAVGPIDGNV